MEGAARSTHTTTPAAGLSQPRPMLVTCSVRPSRWPKIVTMSRFGIRVKEPIPNPESIANLDGEGCLRRRQPRDRDAVRRRAHVVEPHLVKEVDRRRVAAVLAADADLEIAPRPTPALDADANEIAHAFDID